MSAAAVFAISLFILGWNIRGTTIGAAYSDPVAQVRAQDESTYVNSAMRMTEDGDWLTPKLMGRPFLFKAPLTQWLSAICIEIAGLGLMAVRLPSLIFGAAGVAIVFAWTGLRRAWPASLAAALLLLSDPVWMIFSRLVFTDVLSATLALSAMYALAADTSLCRRRSRISFGVLAGAAVLAKSIAGVLPFIALGLYWIVAPREQRPRFRHIAECVLTGVVVAAPWHVYQAFAHPQWFWAEFVKYQLLAVGVTESTGITGYSFFYLRRLGQMDPVLLIASAFVLYGTIRALRRRDPVEIAALCWCATIVLALAGFRGRSVSYMVLLIPALCVLAGLHLPRLLERRWAVVLGLIAAAFAVKAASTGHAWSLPYRSVAFETVTALREYYRQNRDTTLTIGAPSDAFYAIVLPGLQVRYCYVDPTGAVARSLPHYLDLGIAVTPAQLADLPRWIPVFSTRLVDWGVHSSAPVASAILLNSPVDMQAVVRALPLSDFYVPADWEPILSAALRDTHTLQRSGTHLFALARPVQSRSPSLHPLPTGW